MDMGMDMHMEMEMEMGMGMKMGMGMGMEMEIDMDMHLLPDGVAERLFSGQRRGERCEGGADARGETRSDSSQRARTAVRAMAI